MLRVSLDACSLLWVKSPYWRWATARVVSAVAACSGCRRQRIAGQKRGGIALLEKVTHADGGLLGALDTSILTEGLVTLVLGTTSRCLGCCNRL